MKLNPIQTKLYNTAYKCLNNAANGKTKDAVENFTELYKLGKNNPTTLKLATRKAEVDILRHEIFDKGLTYGFYPPKRIFNYLKFDFNKNVRKINKEFKDIYNNLYPKTGAIRNKLIKNRKVSL